jgi:type II secretion system protein G
MSATGHRGFTLIELMIVVVIIGILVGIAAPNFSSMQGRAKEANVKANMHALQLTFEDYSTLNDGFYPTVAEKADVKAMFPGGAWPVNPFTGVALADAEVPFDADPANPGEMAANPATVDGYIVKGFGKAALLLLELSNL